MGSKGALHHTLGEAQQRLIMAIAAGNVERRISAIGDAAAFGPRWWQVLGGDW